MKRIPTQKNGFWKRVFINIPFILLVALMIACFGGGLLLCFYSIVSVIAFDSAMIYLIVAGAGAILIGIGLCLITAYQKYFAFYNKKMGWKYVEDENKKPEKTVTYENKPALEKVKKVLTVSNVGIAILALGSVFAIISAALGSIDRANWVNAIGGFREERGYYTDVRNEPVSFPLGGVTSNQKTINNVTVLQPSSGDRRKNIFVVYTMLPDRQGRVEVKGYKKFEDDFGVSRKTVGNNDTVTVSIGEAPTLTDTLDKLLFFVFDDYIAEKQIYIYIPYFERDNITITADTYTVLYEKADGTVGDEVIIVD